MFASQPPSLPHHPHTTVITNGTTPRQCGVLDFTFQDLYKPTRERLSKIFSYIINFIRFRESQTPTIDEHFNRAENTKRRIETLLAGNAAHESTLAELRRSQASVDAALRERDARSAQLKSRLLELKRGQERVSERLERVRAEQARLKLHLEDKTTTLLSLRADAAKLRPYTAQPASALSAHLATLSASLTADRATAETLDRRARALATSSDAFATVTADIAACTTHLADLRRDLAADDAQAAQAAGTADTLAARSAAVRDLDRHERLLAKQLDNALRRTQRLRDAADARREDEARRMAELRRVNDEIRVERADAAREADRRRARVEQTEKRVRDLRERLDAEVAGVVAEYASMQAHVRGYMEEMEACIAV